MKAAAGFDSCGWHGPVSAFLDYTADDGRGARGESDLLSALMSHYQRCMNMRPDAGQVSAWRNEFRVLHESLTAVATRVPRARRWEIIFEYELPRERGRRPDVVILTGSQVMVLEFKDAATPQRAHIDQVTAYARDLSEYHAASHDKLIDPLLVLTLSSEPARVVGEEEGASSATPSETGVAECRRRGSQPSPGSREQCGVFRGRGSEAGSEMRRGKSG